MPKPRWIAPTFAVLLVVAAPLGARSAHAGPWALDAPGRRELASVAAGSPLLARSFVARLVSPGDAGPGTTVTLVTGDRVTVTPTGDGRPAAAIEPARWPGRRVDFRTTYVDGG